MTMQPPGLQPITSEDPLAPLIDSARSYVDDARAPNTRRAYRCDWAAWVTWCAEHLAEPMPATPAVLAAYLAELADQGRTVATIERALVAISQAHRAANHPSPRSSEVVRLVMKGIRRRVGTAPCQRAPIVAEQLRMMVTALPPRLLGVRDRALLVLGFAGAFRRSELVGLMLADLDFTPEGLVVTLRRSKTDQDGAGRKIAIPYGSYLETCPVRSTRAWIDAAHISDGPLLRAVSRHGHVSPHSLNAATVARVVQRTALIVGLDPTRLAGHSLRAGLATTAAKAGKSERSIMHQTGHRSVVMVRRYIRDGVLFHDNAAAGIGL